MAFKIEVKNVPILVLPKVLFFSSLHRSGGAWPTCTQQTEKSYAHTTSAVSCQVHVHALLVQHLYSVFYQHMVWYGPTSERGWV